MISKSHLINLYFDLNSGYFLSIKIISYLFGRFFDKIDPIYPDAPVITIFSLIFFLYIHYFNMEDIKKLILLLPEKLKKKIYFTFSFMVFLAFLEIISIGAVVPVVGILIDPSFVSQNEILKNIFDYFKITDVQNYIYFALLVLLICMF